MTDRRRFYSLVRDLTAQVCKFWRVWPFLCKINVTLSGLSGVRARAEGQRTWNVGGRRNCQKSRVKMMAHGVSMRSRGPWQFSDCAPCIIEADGVVRLWNINSVDVLPAD